MILFLEKRSAKIPPIGEISISGKWAAINSNPIRLAYSVFSLTQKIIDISNKYVPSLLTKCPCRSSTKFLLM